MPASVKIILTDIEGTTSSISFVKDTLFPYAAEHLPSYIRHNVDDTAVQQQLASTAAMVHDEGGNVDATDIDAVTRVLLGWIAEDRKATPLKALQGMIWEDGYRNGDYQAHMYPDATEHLRQWHERGIPLYVYSSGSVRAQELFFGFSQDGDLLPLFSGHFDTRVGAKQEADAYRKILKQLQKQHEVESSDVLFLSDIESELDAAREAGMVTCWLVRDDATDSSAARHPVARSFADIKI
ncbi:MAG: acireductone synthase [Oceanospirillaceae bacterium]|nr:acireductone synthase [Oceanospirillaceae bacterium]|tara:strand:+ start:1147 stop:1863 length:717 start_codon:yes stop_codon:yes gene_type:complete